MSEAAKALPEIHLTYQVPWAIKPPRGYEKWLVYSEIARKYAVSVATVKRLKQHFGKPKHGTRQSLWYDPVIVDLVMKKRVEAKAQVKEQFLAHRYSPERLVADAVGVPDGRKILSGVPLRSVPLTTSVPALVVRRPVIDNLSQPRSEPEPAIGPTTVPAPSPVPVPDLSLESVVLELPSPRSPELPCHVETVVPPATVEVSEEPLAQTNEIITIAEPPLHPGVDADDLRNLWQESFEQSKDVRQLIIEKYGGGIGWKEAKAVFTSWSQNFAPDAVDDLFSFRPEAFPLIVKADIRGLMVLIEQAFVVDQPTASQMIVMWLHSPAGAPMRRRLQTDAERKTVLEARQRQDASEMEAASAESIREFEKANRTLAKSWKEHDADQAKTTRENDERRDKGRAETEARRQARKATPAEAAASPALDAIVSALKKAFQPD